MEIIVRDVVDYSAIVLLIPSFDEPFQAHVRIFVSVQITSRNAYDSKTDSVSYCFVTRSFK